MTDARTETTAGRVSVIRRQDTYDSWHFAEATRVGNVVWVSGQRGFDAADKIPDDAAAQARIAFENLAAVLRAAGAELGDLVSLTTYHTDMADVDAFRAVKDEFVKPPYPTWTVVGIRELADPSMKVEIAAVAVIGEASQ